jgi:hypothetical protein
MLSVSTWFLFDSLEQTGTDYMQARGEHSTSAHERRPGEWRSTRGDFGRRGK